MCMCTHWYMYRLLHVVHVLHIVVHVGSYMYTYYMYWYSHASKLKLGCSSNPPLQLADEDGGRGCNNTEPAEALPLCWARAATSAGRGAAMG